MIPPWQSGVGDVANAVLGGFMDNRSFRDIDIYSEVLQDAVLDLIDLGIVILPHAYHAEGIATLLEAGVHVITEPVQIRSCRWGCSDRANSAA